MAARGRGMPMPGMASPGMMRPASPGVSAAGSDSPGAPRAVFPGAPGGFSPFAPPRAGDSHVQESTDLFNAALGNDLAGVKKAAEAGGDVNVIDLKGVSPLVLAVHVQNTEMVKYLLSKKADPNLCSTNSSPVHEAVKVGNQAILDILLSAGGNVNLTTDFGKTPLHMAIQTEQEGIVDYLLSKKADVKAKNDGGVGCIHFAAASTNLKIMEKMLNLREININERNGNGKTALHIAAEKNNIDMIKVLLNKGADTKVKDGWGRLPEECGKQAAYRMIHDHVAGTKYEFIDANAPDKKGEKPLFDVGDI